MDSAHWFIGVVFCGSAIVATMRCYQSGSGKLVVSLSWAWPHVPCHTLGSIRDNYEFGLVLSYHGASLATGVQVVSYANCTTMLKNALRRINVKP